MSKTASVFARVESDVKSDAEAVLKGLGISMSNAIAMFLRQLVIENGIPFEIKSSSKKPINYAELTKEEFDLEMQKGIDDILEGRTYTADEVEAYMESKYR